MRAIIQSFFILMAFSLNAQTQIDRDYQKSECYLKFKDHVKTINQNHLEKANRYLRAKQEPSFLTQFIDAPEELIDFEIDVLSILDLPENAPNYQWPKKFQKFNSEQPKNKRFSLKDIQKAIKIGFVKDEFCGFLKGFGTVKRFISKTIISDDHMVSESKVNNDLRSTASKEEVSSEINQNIKVNKN